MFRTTGFPCKYRTESFSILLSKSSMVLASFKQLRDKSMVFNCAHRCKDSMQFVWDNLLFPMYNVVKLGRDSKYERKKFQVPICTLPCHYYTLNLQLNQLVRTRPRLMHVLQYSTRVILSQLEFFRRKKIDFPEFLQYVLCTLNITFLKYQILKRNRKLGGGFFS